MIAGAFLFSKRLLHEWRYLALVIQARVMGRYGCGDLNAP